MNPNICNNCGGDYEYRHGRWICRACGSYKPEEISNEEVTLLYTAFQKLRLAEFSEAEIEFDDILQKYPQNPNAYWGRLMAKYGIKYEQDFDGRMIPTCYATSIESILSAQDYQKALQYADEESKAYYTEQAEYIERVRKEWVEKARKEKPYDVFICYKDSDLANGIKRTQDSIDAQDIYTFLTDLGYHVFYSHITLRDKAGEKYEPYIFNALSTAKVMIVYGSKPEYITSTWLKNEWTRYQKRIKMGEKPQGSLLVACDGFSPNELPTVLSSMQCFDASEKAFYHNLEHRVAELLSKEKTKAAPAPVLKEEKKKPKKEKIKKEKIKKEKTPKVKPKKSKKRIIVPVLISLFLISGAVGGFFIWGNMRTCTDGNHIGTRGVSPAYPATCTEDGCTEWQKCMTCGEFLTEPPQLIPALGHNFDANGNCIVCGKVVSWVEIGQNITFGSYEQDNNTENGKEEIEWIVLDVQSNGRALVISKYALDCQKYNSTLSNVTWETCSLRQWLNNDFLNAAFSDEEKAKIPTVTVSVDKNLHIDTDPGNATQDKIFLLSSGEVFSEYFNNVNENAGQCEATDYAKSQGATSSKLDDFIGKTLWWLRSPGKEQNFAATALLNGGINSDGAEVNRNYAVRPAMWIDLSA